MSSLKLHLHSFCHYSLLLMMLQWKKLNTGHLYNFCTDTHSLHELFDHLSLGYLQPVFISVFITGYICLSHLLFFFPSCPVISAVCCRCVPVLDVWHPACLFSSLLFAACMFFFLSLIHDMNILVFMLASLCLLSCFEERSPQCWIHTEKNGSSWRHNYKFIYKFGGL